MKTSLLLVSIFLGLNAFASSELVLDPGSKVTVNAGDTLTIACSGTGGSGSGGADCTITTGGNKDKYGTSCNESSSYYCANYYQFGGRIDWNIVYGAPSSAAEWCRQKMKQ